MKNICSKCGSTETIIKEKGVHTGVYCAYCSSWIAWAKKKDVKSKLKDSKETISVTNQRVLLNTTSTVAGYLVEEEFNKIIRVLWGALERMESESNNE